MLLMFAVNTPNLPPEIQAQVITVANNAYQTAIVEITKLQSDIQTAPVASPVAPTAPDTLAVPVPSPKGYIGYVALSSDTQWQISLSVTKPIYTSEVRFITASTTRTVKAIKVSDSYPVYEEGTPFYIYTLSLCFDTAEIPPRILASGLDEAGYKQSCGGAFSIDQRDPSFRIGVTTKNDELLTSDILTR